MKKTASSLESISILNRLAYIFKLVLLNIKRKPPRAIDFVNQLDVVSKIYEHYTNKPSSSARYLEIGFGGRPYRAYAAQAKFGNVIAVDLDQPIIRFNDFFLAYKKNGAFSAIKSFIRRFVFDRGELKALGAARLKRLTTNHL